MKKLKILRFFVFICSIIKTQIHRLTIHRAPKTSQNNKYFYTPTTICLYGVKPHQIKYMVKFKPESLGWNIQSCCLFYEIL